MIANKARPRGDKRAGAAPALDHHELGAKVVGILNRRPAVGLAVGVVRGGRLDFFSSHGVADVASMTPITGDTFFRIASITKTFTAVAVMQLWERGLVDLDAPANDYLRAFQLVPARPGFRPATPRHLLTHTSGIPEMVHPERALMYVFGESFKLDEPVPTLVEYYGGRLRLVVEPGTRWTYTDHNFAALGQIVEDVSGEPLDRYLREHVFEPLGMTDTDLNRTQRVESRLATGYNLRSHGPKPVADRQWVTTAAGMAYSTPRDMARYVAALAGGGANEHGSMLKPATLAMMFQPQYRPDPRIPGIGLAFDRFNIGGHFAVGHGGILPGFNSEIFVAPDDGVGVMSFTNGARLAMLWLPAETAQFLGDVIGVPPDAVRTDVPQHPELWGDICGRYQLTASATDTRLRAMVGLGVEVFVRRGELMLRCLNPLFGLYRGFVLHPADDNDPFVFVIDASHFGLGLLRVVFSRDPERGSMRVCVDVFPISLEKQPAGRSPRRWLVGAAGALTAGAAVVAIGRRRAINRRKG